MQMKGEPTRRWEKYSSFDVGAEYTGFKLHVSGFTGSLGLTDRLNYHNRMKFSTYDVDNSGGSCCINYKGARGTGIAIIPI